MRCRDRARGDFRSRPREQRLHAGGKRDVNADAVMLPSIAFWYFDEGEPPFMDRAIPWIMLASAVAAAGSAIAAAFSAFFSSRSSQTAVDAAATNLVLKIRGQYASNEMFIDLRNLLAWRDKYGSQFAPTWQQKLAINDKEAEIVDFSRRRLPAFSATLSIFTTQVLFQSGSKSCYPILPVSMCSIR